MDLSKKILNVHEYICVGLSGGADSAIIYYALCKKLKYTDTKIIVITLDTAEKNQNIATAKRIIQITKDITGVEPIKHKTNTVHDNSEKSYIKGQEILRKKVWKKYGSKVPMYNGLTKNPPHEEMVDFFKNNADRLGLDINLVLHHINNRDISRDKLPSNVFRRTDLFADTDKKGVAAAYKHYNMIEKLYPYTFSCSDPPYKIGSNGIPMHCGYCFPCLERWYAFGKLV